MHHGQVASITSIRNFSPNVSPSPSFPSDNSRNSGVQEAQEDYGFFALSLFSTQLLEGFWRRTCGQGTRWSRYRIMVDMSRVPAQCHKRPAVKGSDAR
ncbi:hypothetical protein TNCV_107161 [Trichonephila clavipes]|nr:hypothetical protein TNCV_107161 [Trichonephila clavipes]